MKKMKVLALVLVFAMALGLAACAQGQVQSDAMAGQMSQLPNLDETVPPTFPEEIPATTAAAVNITMEQAKEIAYRAAGVAEADAVDKSYEMDNGVYEIEFQIGNMEYDYYIDPVSGGILRYHKEADSVAPNATQPDQTGYIGWEKAEAIALENAGVKAADVTREDYDLEYGVYEIEFCDGTNEFDYEIDAVTGAIRNVRKELCDDRWDVDDNDRDDRYDDRDDRYDDWDEDDVVVEQPNYIGLNKAKSIAYGNAGVAEADAVDKSYELENGVYEIEFQVGDTEYEYKVDAVTGKILRSHKEIDRD